MAALFAHLRIIKDGIFAKQKSSSPPTTNRLFRFHTKYCSATLILGGVMHFVTQFFVDHLKCVELSEKQALPNLTSTHRIQLPMPSATFGSGLSVSSSKTHTGVEEHCHIIGTYSTRHESDILFQTPEEYETLTQFHHYFSWVPILLLLQGFMLYVPELIWENLFERGKIAFLSAEENDVEVDTVQEEVRLSTSQDKHGDDGEKTVATNLSSDLIVVHPRFKINSQVNKMYFYGFILCEILNLLLIFVCFLTTDWFMNGKFLLYGIRWMSYVSTLGPLATPPESEIVRKLSHASVQNPLESAFPSIFLCSIPNVHYSCVFALNVAHQRLYLLFWNAFSILLLFGLVNLGYRVWTIASFQLRVYLLKRRITKMKINTPFLKTEMKQVLEQLDAADWFILKRILRYGKPSKFHVILVQIKQSLDNRKKTVETCTSIMEIREVESKPQEKAAMAEENVQG